MEKERKVINLNIKSKYKKDVAKEIYSKIKQFWEIEFLEVKYCGQNEWEISFANYSEKYINTLLICMDVKEKTKTWNLNKDFNIGEYLYKYRKDEELFS